MKTGKRIGYSDAFKHEAMRLVTEQRLSRTPVARDLGMSIDTLARWLRAATPPATSVPPDEARAAELARLRRELAIVRMERDILKKAVGIFSQMPQ